MNKRFWNAGGCAVIGLMLFASVIWDMGLSGDNAKRFTMLSIVLLCIALYQRVRGLQERARSQKEENLNR